jgi:molecular chaperone DnaK
VFSTAEDNQHAVTIRVFQGEREMAAANKLLGQFNLEGIPPSPRGMPQIEVTFDIDANGIVHVSAKDKASGKEQKVAIQASGGLTDADIEQMVKDAEAYSAEDKARREVIDAKNHADGLIYSTEKSLKEYGDKISEDERKAIESGITDLKAALEKEELEDLKSKTDALSTAAMKLGEAMYKATQAEGGAATMDEASKATEEGKVVDAEFEEKKD